MAKPWDGPVITPFVIAPDVIVDLIMGTGEAGAVIGPRTSQG